MVDAGAYTVMPRGEDKGDWAVNAALSLNAVSIHRPRKVSRCNWDDKSAPPRLRHHRQAPETEAVSSVGSTMVADMVPIQNGPARFRTVPGVFAVGREVNTLDGPVLLGNGLWVSISVAPQDCPPGDEQS